MGKVKKVVEISHDIRRAFSRAKKYIRKKLESFGRKDLADEITDELEAIEEEEIGISLTRKKTKREQGAEKDI
jgi:hypothetical protein